jgi:hypothetical protein
MLVAYLALADSAVRRVLQLLVQDSESKDDIIDAAADWAFRTAAATLAIELAIAFFELRKLPGMILAIVGVVLLMGSMGIPVGSVFRKRVGPRWLPKRPTFGRLIQIWLLGTFAFLAELIWRGVNATH